MLRYTVIGQQEIDMTDDIVGEAYAVAEAESIEATKLHICWRLAKEIESLRHDNTRLQETASELATENAALLKSLDRLERCIKFKQPDGSVSKITNWYSAALAMQDIREAMKGETE